MQIIAGQKIIFQPRLNRLILRKNKNATTFLLVYIMDVIGHNRKIFWLNNCIA